MSRNAAETNYASDSELVSRVAAAHTGAEAVESAEAVGPAEAVTRAVTEVEAVTWVVVLLGKHVSMLAAQVGHAEASWFVLVQVPKMKIAAVPDCACVQTETGPNLPSCRRSACTERVHLVDAANQQLGLGFGPWSM